ncbi:hypothetical protein [Kutzneria kofuensis]|uniref:DUF7847 domain-containing protein n=1 Tax=Kutzneria kofuensis TaxID=103725 RepID=A0A7W9KN40_9PSEU|nr:hypothetical protein [Kutzneria kofuensis]MBB5895592.1 hypothetical protein [Kutzneria kofuensis]
MTDNPEQYLQYPQQYVQPPPEAPQPGVLPLRPVDVGAMINGSFRAIFRNWRSAILVPLAAYLTAMLAAFAPARGMIAAFADMAGRRRPTDDQFWAFLQSWLVFAAVLLVVFAAAYVVTQAVVTVVVSRAVLGRTTTFGQALRAAAPRMLPLSGLVVLVGLMVFGCVFVPFGLMVLVAVATGSGGVVGIGILLCLGGVVLAYYLLISYVLAPTALILEPAPVLTALRRSSWLVRGGWWRVFGIFLLAMVMSYVASYLVQIPISAVQFTQLPNIMNSRNPDPAAMFGALLSPPVMIAFGVLYAVAMAITQPFMIGVLTLLYHDLRIRKESFHLPLWEMSQQPDDLVTPPPSAHPEATT